MMPGGALLILAHDAPAARRAHPQKVRRPAHHEQIHLAENGPGIHHRPAVHRRARGRGPQAFRDRLGYLRVRPNKLSYTTVARIAGHSIP